MFFVSFVVCFLMLFGVFCVSLFFLGAFLWVFSLFRPIACICNFVFLMFLCFLCLFSTPACQRFLPLSPSALCLSHFKMMSFRIYYVTRVQCFSYSSREGSIIWVVSGHLLQASRKIHLGFKHSIVFFLSPSMVPDDFF